jgi:hypothetical protein
MSSSMQHFGPRATDPIPEIRNLVFSLKDPSYAATVWDCHVAGSLVWARRWR